jgi:hypothetical protein
VSAALWAGTLAGAFVAGLCVVLLRRLHHAPALAHPWLCRLAIFGMYVGGCAMALTAAGGYVTRLAAWAASPVPGGLEHGWVHFGIMIAGVILFLDVAIALWKAPDPSAAWWALALPFTADLSAGHLHGVLTVFPAVDWCQQLAVLIGGL